MSIQGEGDRDNWVEFYFKGNRCKTAVQLLVQNCCLDAICQFSSPVDFIYYAN